MFLNLVGLNLSSEDIGMLKKIGLLIAEGIGEAETFAIQVYDLVNWNVEQNFDRLRGTPIICFGEKVSRFFPKDEKFIYTTLSCTDIEKDKPAAKQTFLNLAQQIRKELCQDQFPRVSLTRQDLLKLKDSPIKCLTDQDTIITIQAENQLKNALGNAIITLQELEIAERLFKLLSNIAKVECNVLVPRDTTKSA